MAPHKDHSEEIARLVERAESDPRTHTFARLADLYRKSGELERALAVVENGLRHHPHYLNARLVHARVLRELDRPRDARTAFERVLQIDSENLVARAALTELGAGDRVEPPRTGDPARSRGWLASLDADWRSVTGESPAANGAEASPAVGNGSEPEDYGDEIGTDDAVPPARHGEAAAPEPPEERAAEPPSHSDPSAAPELHASAGGEVGHPAGSDPTEVETATLAALYVRQGLLDRAIAIYERLLARDPYNARLASALEEARGLGQGRERSGGVKPAAVAPPSRPTPSDRRAENGRAERTTDDEAQGDEAHSGAAPDLPMREFLARLLDGEAEVDESKGRVRWPDWLRQLGGSGD